MRKLFALSIATLFSIPALAGTGSGTVTKIYTHVGDVVLFSTQSHVHDESRNACIAEQGANTEWAITLTTETGKAMYAQLLAAATQKKPVVVVGANDCNDFPGRERPSYVVVDY